jgi:hypothetical protein
MGAMGAISTVVNTDYLYHLPEPLRKIPFRRSTFSFLGLSEYTDVPAKSIHIETDDTLTVFEILEPPTKGSNSLFCDL